MTNKTYIYEYSNRDIKTKHLNSTLRDFYQKSDKPYILLYNNKTELPELDTETLNQICAKYETAQELTHLHYLVGKVIPLKTFDYGSIKINYGTFTEQKIVFEFLTRQAISKAGYFDVRFADNCRCADYVHRLSEIKLYPHQDINKQPSAFDIVHEDTSSTAKHVFDELSCGWYNYKHQNFLQLKQSEQLETVVENIKSYKKLYEQK